MQGGSSSGSFPYQTLSEEKQQTCLTPRAGPKGQRHRREVALVEHQGWKENPTSPQQPSAAGRLLPQGTPRERLVEPSCAPSLLYLSDLEMQLHPG